MGGLARLRLLLDTHIWLWSVQDYNRLSKRVQTELIDPANEKWLSPISTWEILTLNQKNRVALLPNAVDWIADATAPFREAPLTHEIAVAASQLQLQHSDPADRLLAATAKVLGLTLVTADTVLLGLRELATLANR
jgi:PIN domain nuclease of toxin-antitoxin system